MIHETQNENVATPTTIKSKTNQDNPSSRCYTVVDLMQILDVGKDAVYSLLKQKEFRSIRIPGVGYRIPKESFETWLYKK